MPYPLCRHRHAAGNSCSSPAVKGAQFCFYHRPIQGRHRNLCNAILDPKPLPAHPFDLTQLEDREAIQAALSTVVTALAAGRLETRKAGILLFGLQLAASNAASLDI
jgi:hypothetical protein